MSEIEREERFAVVEGLLDILCEFRLERVSEKREDEGEDGFVSAREVHKGRLLRSRGRIGGGIAGGVGVRFGVALAEDIG